MKFYKAFIFSILLVVMTFVMISLDKKEENLIGSWKEIEWTFEQNRNPHVTINDNADTLSADVKAEIGRHLLIHAAENWKFNANNQLYIRKSDEEKNLCRWYIKGRGNVLEIMNPDNNITETYEIVHLSKDSLVLSFEVDLQLQGLAKMKFKRTND